MVYGSVCSGIEAASVAWHTLGWTPAWFCEIEPFPSAVLKERYPHVQNYGDFTRLSEPDHPVRSTPIDVLVGGTPCQAFSVAGLREGMRDPRGGLTLEYVRLARALRPKWLVWENVPGVLSSGQGRDFGAFVGALVESGYGVAWRVLDAQHVRVDGYPHAVPQRRKRVFVVGHSGGDAARAASVLFEPEGVRGHTPPRRASRKATSSDAVGGIEISMCLNAGSMGRRDAESETLIPQQTSTFAKTHKPMSDTDAEGWSPQDHSPTITYWPRDRSDVGTDVAVVQTMSVRRLTPTECERLQGFPDGWTQVAWKGKAASECPDGPRYKALGNSMAVNCMRWIGARIQAVEEA